uniref:Variant surface glycoprotein 707 n=1 Tax=Trypanosoma brucei TaxID=5691 RepID=M4SX84_9TRYP|nr:variant surface glycoprotein 707 [Trypanosoma brucei]
MMAKLLVITLHILPALALGQQAADQAAAATTICAAADSLVALSQQLTEQAATVGQPVSALTKALLQLQAGALLAGDRNRRAIAAALHAKVAKIINAVKGQVKTADNKLGQVRTRLAEARQRLLTYERLKATKVQTTDSGNSDGSNGGAALNVQFTEPTGLQARCTPTLSITKEAAKNWLTAGNIGKFKLFTLTANPKTGAARGPAICKGQTSTRCATTNLVDGPPISSGTNLGIVGGDIFKDKAIALAIEEGADFVPTPEADDNTDDEETVVKRLAQHLKDLAPTLTTDPTAFDYRNPAKLQADSEFKENLYTALHPGDEPFSETKHGESINQLISTSLGESPETFNTQFWTLLTDTPLIRGTLTADTEATVKDIKTVDQLAKVLIYFTQLQITKNKVPASAQNQPSNTTENCKAKTKKQDCKDSDGCKWTNEKEETGSHCKAKDGERKTNTAAGAGQAAKEEGKKCSDKKKEEECKDGCKWEGED